MLTYVSSHFTQLTFKKSAYLWSIFLSHQFSWIACWHIVNWKTVSWSSSCDMKVDQHLSLRVWRIHLKIMRRYARGSCCTPPPLPPPKKRDAWWLKTMLLHTICSVISVKLLMINNSWWCVVFRNPYVSIGSCIVCHCFKRTSLMIQGCVIIPFGDLCLL